MEKQRKPLSTKKPPTPSKDFQIIADWMTNRIMPGIQPMVEKIDLLIHEIIPNPNYAIKWGNAFYGTNELGWVIEVAAYDISVNVVFLNGAVYTPQPPLGSGGTTRYIKLKNIVELSDPLLIEYMKQSTQVGGWS